jgi:hypothetical protein
MQIQFLITQVGLSFTPRKRSNRFKSPSEFQATPTAQPFTSSLHYHFLRPSRRGKIILSNHQVTLLCDPWRIIQPTANHMQ